MNKLFIVLLAVCLVTVHGFVKRDAGAEAAPGAPGASGGNNLLESAQKSLQDLGEQFKQAFDPEKVKQGLQNMQTEINKALDSLKSGGGGEKKA